MPISAIRNGTGAPPRGGGFRAHRVSGDRIADGDDYPELARLKTLIATFLEASGLRVGREADDAESNGVRFDERLAVRAPSPSSGAATLAPRVGAPETSHLVDLAATAHELRLPLSHIKG